ncbi:hypothetical protein [Streptomyces chiangmaiensis]|uniref:Secreted protein n=1 Tax=Streptomyces chiangmaiensis TaxID=766497 RepID=A0ABU7FDJ0_9ACTN|nr:hypothetical protein [Streptomyces chiangmaiensis]MED7821974.1 hypothetical protein [Streptomyces chiangmaiensis]
MRCSARVLSAAVAGAALGAVAAPASADPAAHITPRSVAPGGLVTVSVSCAAAGSTLPEFIDAASRTFEEGKVRLTRADGYGAGDGTGMRARSPNAVLYTGTARIPVGGTASGIAEAAGPDAEWGVDGRCPVTSGDREKPWNVSFTVTRDGPGGQSLVAGGVLIAAALGAHVHRLWRHGLGGNH